MSGLFILLACAACSERASEGAAERAAEFPPSDATAGPTVLVFTKTAG